jgi:succinoglycan biosynthesis protein ExoM
MIEGHRTGVFFTDPMEEPILCSVCIATHRRPQLLEKLLGSLESQYLPRCVTMEVIVVDNDPGESAGPVVSKFQETARGQYFYHVQPKKNISLTRNMAVAHARGRYLLFIDDDETASERWLYCLLGTLLDHDADAVFGPVVPEFNEKAPLWVRHSPFFYPCVGETGTVAQFAWTSNCMIKASLLRAEGIPFSPSYGITGGEDTHLFDRLERKGARFVCCKEALVCEYLPAERTRLFYLLLRWLKGGNADARRRIEFAGRRHLEVRLFLLMKGMVFGTTSLALSVGFLHDPRRRTHWLLRLGSNLGRVLAVFNYHYRGYR